MKQLKTILLTLVLLICSAVITFILLVMCAIAVVYPLIVALPVITGLVALLLINAYQTAYMLTNEREDDTNQVKTYIQNEQILEFEVYYD